MRRVKFRVTSTGGYHGDDVDELLDRVAIQLEAGQSPAATVRRAELRQARRGYDVTEVDRFLMRLDGSAPPHASPGVSAAGESGRSGGLVRMVVAVGYVIGVVGVIGYRSAPRSDQLLWGLVALIGLGVVLGWEAVAVIRGGRGDEPADERHMFTGTALAVGGLGGFLLDLGRLSILEGVIWAAAGLVGCALLLSGLRSHRR